MLSNFVMIARVTAVRSALPRYIIELVAIICTSLKSLFWVDSATETRIVRWKVTPVQWKGPNVYWKATPSAVECWSSQQIQKSQQKKLPSIHLLVIVEASATFFTIHA